MSDDLLKQDESKDEDVEAHKHKFTGTEDPKSDDDDVEAHRHKTI